RYQIWAGTQLLKDFGPLEREASEALRLIRNLNFSQYGTIAGATPPFEFWLSDGEGAKGGLVVKNVIPFNNRTLRIEQIVGAWMIRDDRQFLYNFGNAEDAARQALAIMQKYGFNQLGIVGVPKPAMTYLTIDSNARGQQPPAQPSVKEVIGTIASQGLLLPNI